MKNRTTTGIFYLDSLTVYDYYPYGMLKPGRYYEDAWSRYGFNGMEKDDDIKGEGNSYDFGARVYDPRTVRWNSVDPLANDYPALSGYSYCGGNPIAFKDPDGKKLVDANGSVIISGGEKSPTYLVQTDNYGKTVYVSKNYAYIYTNNGTQIPVFIFQVSENIPDGSNTPVYSEQFSFNCHGHSVGNVAVFIHPNYMRQLIEEDLGSKIEDIGITDIKETKPGYIALFIDENGLIIHSAKVNEDFTLSTKNGQAPLNNSATLEETKKVYEKGKDEKGNDIDVKLKILFVPPVQDKKIETLNQSGKDGYSLYPKDEVVKELKKENENKESNSKEEKGTEKKEGN